MTENLRDFVVELSKTNNDEQRSAIEKICFDSRLKGVELALEALKVIESSKVDEVKNKERFLKLCNSTINSFQAIVDSGRLTKDKKKEVIDSMMAVIKEASDSGIIGMIYADDCLPCLTVVGLIATTLSRNRK